MSTRHLTAGVAVLGIVALLGPGCARTVRSQAKPPVVEPDDWSEPGVRAEAERAFALAVAAHQDVHTWTPQACDAIATRFERVFATNPKHMSVALFNAGAVREQCGQTKAAEAIYQRVVAADPLSDLAHNQLGVIAARRGDLAAALPHFHAAVQANPTTRAPRNNLAGVLRDRYATKPEDASFRSAEDQAQNVLAVDSDNLAAFENLARLYYDHGRLVDKSYLLLSDLVVGQGLKVAERTGAKSPDMHVIRGLIAMQRGADVRALRSFEKAIELAPNHGDAHMNIAMIALRFRDFDHARKSLAVAEKSSRYGNNVETYLGLGVAHRGLRHYGKAQQAFERAQALDAADPRPLYNLGILYQEHVGPAAANFDLSHSRKAIAYFEQFAKQAAGNQRFATEIGDAKFRVSVIEESIEIAKRWRELEEQAAAMEKRAAEEEQAARARMLEIEERARQAHDAGATAH